VLAVGLNKFIVVDEAVMIVVELLEDVANLLTFLLSDFAENEVALYYRDKVVLPLYEWLIT
jgi:ATP adenylyltransferase/5',5'''-P-1,P-4-tetraphosphate phosphorylase II